MSGGEWARIEEIFQHAVELSSEERTKFLHRVCGSDEALRRTVELLLAHAKEDGDTFANPLLKRLADSTAGQTLIAGARLGPYEIIGFIGAGGMGEVYRARDPRLRRDVALKVLRAEISRDAVRREFFEREARTAAALNHPNLVAIHDIGEDGGIYYIVTEFVDGEHLCARPLEFHKAMDAAAQMAAGIEAAHRAGIVHRDLKPANVLLTVDGQVKILDFGLAKLLAARTEEGPVANTGAGPDTNFGPMLGTPGYMSPEQVKGETMDQRTDLFNFGLIFYELLAGRRAFPGPGAEATDGILHGAPPPLPERVPVAVRRVVGRCLEKDTAERFQSAGDLLRALVASAQPRWAKRRGAAWAGVAAAMLAGALIASRWLRRDSTIVVRPRALTSFIGAQTDPALSPDGKEFAFDWNGDIPHGRAHIYISRVDKIAPVRITPEEELAILPAWSPDGKSIAFFRLPTGKREWELALTPAYGGPIRTIVGRVLERFYFVAPPAWSSDGRWVLWRQWDDITRSAWINVSSVAGGDTRILIREPKGVVLTYPQTVPDGRQVGWLRCVTSFNCDVFVAGFQDGRLTGAPRQITKGHDTKLSFAWTSDGRELLFIAGDQWGEHAIYRAAVSGREPQPIEGIIGNPNRVATAARAPQVVYSTVSVNSDLYRIDLNMPQASAERFLSSTRYDANPSFSPDGKRIAFSSSRRGERQIWLANVDGSDPLQLTSLPEGMASNGSWSPDGRWIVFNASSEGTQNIFVVPATGGSAKRLTFGPAQDLSPTWSPDGQWIYFQSTRADRRQIFRMRPDGGEVRQVTRNGGFYGVASPDSKWLYYAIPANGLWKMPAEGGNAVQVLKPAELSDHFGFVIGSRGIYAEGMREGGGIPVVFHPFNGGKARTLAYLSKTPLYSPTVSPDGRWFVYSAKEDPTYGMMLIESFR